jgi:serine/threonine protein kinase
MDLFWRIAYFLYREDFPQMIISQLSPRVEPDRSLNVEVIERGRNEIKTPPKSLGKLFKGGNLTGEGGYGKVFISRDNVRKEAVAIKKISHTTHKHKESNFSEVGFLSGCSHANIITFYNAYFNSNPKKGIDEVWIISEFVHGGTLAEAAKNFAFKENQVAYIAREVLSALKYLHDKRWAHRDLKSPNIMLTLEGRVKLIDFGLCADMAAGHRTKLLGSAFWIPPEMIHRKPHTETVDIWSFGVCLLELFLRAPPYSSSPLLCMFTVALVGLNSVIPKDSISEHGREFLSNCLNLDNTKRPSAEKLLEHDWLKQKLVSKVDFAAICRSIFMVNTLELII